MGLLTFAINVTLDGCVDHQEGIVDDETHAFFTRLMDESGAMLWGRVTYEMMESYWPAVARGDEEAPPAIREWAVKLETKPKYVVSSTRKDFPWINSHHIAGDLRVGVQKLKDATPAGVLLGECAAPRRRTALVALPGAPPARWLQDDRAVVPSVTRSSSSCSNVSPIPLYAPEARAASRACFDR
ncbi:hypothetical protein WME97_48520 [Sorangium sp. So ce367]